MRKLITFSLLVILVLTGYFVWKKLYLPWHKYAIVHKEVEQLTQNNKLRTGDLIFQTSLSGQSKAIQLATGSEISHCGIVYEDRGSYYVLEAVQPVKMTALEKWIAHGKNGAYTVKRLKNASQVLTPDVLTKMKKEGQLLLGKPYDLTFEWSDDRIYCSELIWKIYKRAAALEVGKVQHLRDFDLSNEVVQKKMKERYGNNIPMDESVISPVSIFNSDLLETVAEH